LSKYVGIVSILFLFSIFCVFVFHPPDVKHGPIAMHLMQASTYIQHGSKNEQQRENKKELLSFVVDSLNNTPLMFTRIEMGENDRDILHRFKR
jgi:hypothetical protein